MMQTRHDSRLAAKVAARNHVNALVLSHAAAMLDALRPFVGTKVTKVDGTLTAKVRKALPPDVLAVAADGVLGSYYSTGHGYSVTANFKTVHTAPLRNRAMGDGAEYAEQTVYLGELHNGVLTKVNDMPGLRTDYTEAEVLDARAAVQTAKAALSDAQSKLFHFGEYDN